jgi:hypothetical protein
MTEVSVRKNRQGEVVMTVRVTGAAEVYRYAYYMAHGPVDHLTRALAVFRYLRRQWGIERFKEHDRRVTAGKVCERGWQHDLGRNR